MRSKSASTPTAGIDTENFGEAASAGTRQRLGQDCAMFGFRAAAARPGAFLESPDERLIDLAHEQIRHVFRAPIV